MRSLDEPWPAGQPIRLCAIRVEFLEDNLTGTTGTGKFNSGFPDTLTIDPLPHNRQYFEDHLAFMQDYFNTVSKGMVTFERLDVYPLAHDSAYTLSFPMWHYNHNSDTALLNRRLVELFAQSTTLASSDINFESYDAILVFHAGVGKDFNIGFDNTPFDIPSAYISESDLRRYNLNLPSGVTRGLILPEGQNQDETLQLGVELSLNGVMIKLFGNWLGMPDLYNTETGASGIGRWGMMDQGSGNVNAMVPAYPDAWSRVFMGWSTANTVLPGGAVDTISLARPGSDSIPDIVKIPISANEYYLLENRNADADSVGHVALYDRDGRLMTVDLLGNVYVETDFKIPVRASHYDFGIPGSGILIWHINDSVVSANYSTNRINANPQYRGVDLVEADGSQDIGREYGFATAGSGTELGVQEDCWYRDNRTHRNANGGTAFVRFNNNTRPAAVTNDQRKSYLSIENFSDIDTVMSAMVSNSIAMDGFPVQLGTNSPHNWSLADIDLDGKQDVCFQKDNEIRGIGSESGLTVLKRFEANVEFDLRASRYPIDVNDNGHNEIWYVAGNDSLGFVEVTNVGTIQRNAALPVSSFSIARLEFLDTDPNLVVLFQGNGTMDFPRRVTIFNSSLNLILQQEVDWGGFHGLSNLTSVAAGKVLFWSSDRALLLDISDSARVVWNVVLHNSSQPTIISGPESSEIYFPNNGYVNFDSGALICPASECLEPIADWDQDGVIDGGGSRGADHTPREDFPFQSLNMDELFDLNFDGFPDLLRVTNESSSLTDLESSTVHAFDHRGARYSDFPLVTLGRPTIVTLDTTERRYYAITEYRSGSHHVIGLLRLPIVPEGQSAKSYADVENRIIFLGPLQNEVHSREEFVYVWPNPTNAIANFRITLPYAASVEAKVFDLAGRCVANLSTESSYAGTFDLQWDTVTVESGVYLGKVLVHGGGQSRESTIKIAVVK